MLELELINWISFTLSSFFSSFPFPFSLFLSENVKKISQWSTALLLVKWSQVLRKSPRKILDLFVFLWVSRSFYLEEEQVPLNLRKCFICYRHSISNALALCLFTWSNKNNCYVLKQWRKHRGRISFTSLPSLSKCGLKRNCPVCDRYSPDGVSALRLEDVQWHQTCMEQCKNVRSKYYWLREKKKISMCIAGIPVECWFISFGVKMKSPWCFQTWEVTWRAAGLGLHTRPR